MDIKEQLQSMLLDKFTEGRIDSLEIFKEALLSENKQKYKINEIIVRLNWAIEQLKK